MSTRGSGAASVVVSRDDVAQDMGDWQHVVTLMEDTAQDFAAAPVAALPPAVQKAGVAFGQAWARYAGESATAAGRVVAALEATLRDFDVTDGRTAEELGGFSVGCAVDPGPAGVPVMPASASGLASRLGPLP